MVKDAEEIKTSVVDQLAELKARQNKVDGRLEKLVEQKAEISQLVYDRIRSDYEARAENLAKEAAPLMEQARLEVRDLQAIMGKAELEVRELEYDKEELEVRHRLEEFDEQELKTRCSKIDSALESSAAQLSDLQEIREKFLDVFGSEEEMSIEQEMEESTSEVREVLPEAEADADEAERKSSATQLLPLAFLSLEDAEGQSMRVPLGPSTSIGRTDDNDVPVEDESVSRHHAEILKEDEGFVIRDLESQNGTYVNGEAVGKHLLTEGDRVMLGAAQFIFRCA